MQVCFNEAPFKLKVIKKHMYVYRKTFNIKKLIHIIHRYTLNINIAM